MAEHSILFVPGVTPEREPWDETVPPILYRYMRPERFPDLPRCLFRFSQRQVFEDGFELRPEVKSFGTDAEIARYIEMQDVPAELRATVLREIQELGPRFVDFTTRRLNTPDEFGVLCLTNEGDSEHMWRKYADNSRGFVIAFNTRTTAFDALVSPGRVGKVEYSDEPFASFLSTYGANAFFRKLTRYSSESEWRAIKALARCPEVIHSQDGRPPIYLAPFNPLCIRKISIRPTCSVEWDLRTLVAVDARYRHVPVVLMKP